MRLAAADAVQEVCQDCLPDAACATTSGWNWMPIQPLLVAPSPRLASCRCAASARSPAGSWVIASPWLIQTGKLVGQVGEESAQPGGRADTIAWPYSRLLAGRDLAAELVGEQLHAVADPEDRQAAAEHEARVAAARPAS